MKKLRSALTDRSGFTLLEAIFSVFILTVIMSLVPLMYHWLSAIERTISLEEDFEWNIFLIQLRDELDTTDSFISSKDRIYLLKNDISIIYGRHTWNVRRQVGGMGHEIVLQNIRRFDVREEDPMLVIQVEFLNGTIEEARFLMPPREEVAASSTNEDPYFPSH